VRGFAYDVVNAVLAAGSDDVVDVIMRAEAVSEVRGSEDFASISVAFKRIKNILRQAHESNKAIADQLDSAALTDDTENNWRPRFRNRGYRAPASRTEKLCRCAGAGQPIAAAVDAFFDKVMVMVDDERVRANRLALLRDLLNEFFHYRRLQRDCDRRPRQLS